MRLMIVDDDYQIREGMQFGVDWESLGVDEVVTCANGMEALEFFHDKAPDIILSDVQMPGMSGLELITKIREIDTKVRVIFVSAYSEFEYCRQALKLGADDYILKPIEFEKLEDMIRKNVEVIKKSRQDNLQYRNLLLEQEMKEIYVKGKEDGRELCEILDNAENLINEGSFLTIVLKISKKDKKLYGDDWVRNFESNIFDSENGVVLPKIGNEIIALAKGNRSELLAIYMQSELRNKLMTWNQTYGERLGHVSAGISRSHDMKHFYRGYSEAKKALDYGFYTGPESIQISPVEFKEEKFRLNEADAVKDMVKFLKDDTYDRIDGLLNQYSTWVREYTIEPVKLKEFGWNAYQKIVAQEEKTELLMEMPEEIAECTYLEEYYEILNRYFYKLWKLLKQERHEAKYSRTVKIALDYVKAHYGEPLTLVEVAEESGKSANYFSSIFKKETGKSFSEYLTWYRMNEAKRLLAETNMKVKEISEKVGYTDYIYFSNVFKKMFGCSASQMRQQNEEK